MWPAVVTSNVPTIAACKPVFTPALSIDAGDALPPMVMEPVIEVAAPDPSMPHAMNS